MITKQASTITADIYCGLQEGYNGKFHSIKEVYKICQDYCDKVGLGVTVTPTEVIYTDGNEPGAIIGLINYPRFPSTIVELSGHVENIIEMCMIQFRQERISVVWRGEYNQTIMYDNSKGVKNE